MPFTRDIMKTTGDQQLVKRINRSVLLRLLRAQPGYSRAQLATGSGLTKSTVSLLVRELIDEGWVTETDITAAQGLGRPSTPLHIDGRSRGLIGVEVAVEALRVVGVSLTGQVLCAAEEALIGTKPEDVCRQTARLVARTYAQLQQRSIALTGVGVGLPGAFDEATGMLRFAPNLGWRNVDFLPMITQALAQAKVPEVPVHVQNEADTAALSEYEFADGDAHDSLIFVTCGAGVGAGIVINDRLFTGKQGMAGEIGHSTLQIDGPLCSCGAKAVPRPFLAPAPWPSCLTRPRAVAIWAWCCKTCGPPLTPVPWWWAAPRATPIPASSRSRKPPCKRMQTPPACRPRKSAQPAMACWPLLWAQRPWYCTTNCAPCTPACRRRLSRRWKPRMNLFP